MQHDLPVTQSAADPMDPARARALGATLGLPGTVAPGDPLPPLFHQIYFWEAFPSTDLGRDGHPRTGVGLIPDTGLPRRMWAGGRVQFHAPLRAGLQAERHATVRGVTRKTGRSGDLAFVALRYEIRQQGELCLTEDRDLVYRADPDPATPRPAPPSAPDTGRVIAEHRADTTLLFRYSALTFNGHRIHYDLPYARDVEGYDGLVVHGPLLAQWLALAAARAGQLATFRYRGTSPLLDHETALICRDGTHFWVRTSDGRLCQEAHVTWA